MRASTNRIELFFYKYMWLEFYRHAQFHITTTPQRVIHIMHYSPTLRHIPAPAVCTRTLAEVVHQGSLVIRTTLTHLCSINNADTNFTDLGGMEG